MNTFPSSNSLSVSMRVYCALLVAYPKKFRDHYETQLVQVFRDSLRDAHQYNGTSGVIDLWLHTCVDLFVTALIERISEKSQYMFSPRIIVWTGIASAFGGVMWLFPVFGGGGELTLPLGLLLTLGVLVTLHARQGQQAGTLGWSGFVLAILGTGLLLSIFVWNMISGNSLNAGRIPLGISIVGIGYILIGLRTLQTRVLDHSSAMLSFMIGVLQTGLGFSVWLMYYLNSDPWNPITIPAIAALLLVFFIGILWVALEIKLATEAGAQLRPPTASA